MKKAWIENGFIRDVAHATPSEIYHPDVAALYDTDVPDDTENGDLFENGVVSKPPLPVLPTDAEIASQQAANKAQTDTEQAASVRASRTEKLKDCDWTQIGDSTADKAAWATYRQALRDITTQEGFPWTVEWPVQP
jgi:hypothetical protein